ncbi:MAG: hypothetical protein ABR581_03550 [Thermoleophilaceae bacterium]
MSTLLLAANEPAGGAAIGQVVIATAFAAVVTAALLWLCSGHRNGRNPLLGRAAAFAGRVGRLPGWTALPLGVGAVSLHIALLGMYWDISLHIDQGRDPGPLANPAHYLILGGLFGVFAAGVLAMALPGADERPGPAPVRLIEGWSAPVGGILMAACGGFALIGFPLDDVWHRLFGQDVTLWGPTHVLMIAGASLSMLGAWVLLVEGRRALSPEGEQQPDFERGLSAWVRLRTIAMGGAFMLALSTLQGEFDYGVPQFQLLYQPILIMLAAGCGLVAARLRLGRFGALYAVAFFLGLRGLLTLIIGPGLGESTLHFPLYVVEAVVVELVAARLTAGRPLTVGAVSGALIGTVGLAAEWGWSHVWMPLPWPSTLLPEAAVFGFAAAVAGGVLGGFIGRALLSGQEVRQRAPRWLLPAAALLAVLCIVYPLPMGAGPHASAAVTLHDVTPGSGRTVSATVRLSPRDAAKDADWLTMTAWQGGGLVVDRLRRVTGGVYRTTEPIPVHGQWKAMLRMENGRGVRAVPVYLPRDTAIPAKEVPAAAHFTRPFVRDKKILQREAVGGSAWLSLPAYLFLLAIAVGWLVAIAFGLRRLERASRPGPQPDAARGRASPGRVRPA